MKLILDTANREDIRYFNTYYPLAGVTTNPTILSREGGNVPALLREIRGIIGEDKELHVQVTETGYERMVAEIARQLGLTTLKFNTIEQLIEAIGLPKCQVCTHCFDGSSKHSLEQLADEEEA